jgi:acetyltransferase-like isoleucine patch superfamily enzyme
MQVEKIRRIGGVQRQLFQPGSMFRRYCETTVGNYCLSDLVKYELVTMMINAAPCRMRQAARRHLYPLIFGHVGRRTIFGEKLIIRRPNRITIGNDVSIEDEVSLDVKGEGEGITIANGVTIGAGTIVSCTGGYIRIGGGTRIGRRCRLGSSLGLEIGEHAVFGDECYLVGAAHAYDRKDIPIIDQPLTCRGPNHVGNQVRIGKGVTVRDGVRIGDDAIVKDDALVINDVPDNAVVAGIPGRFVEART